MEDQQPNRLQSEPQHQDQQEPTTIQDQLSRVNALYNQKQAELNQAGQ